MKEQEVRERMANAFSKATKEEVNEQLGKLYDDIQSSGFNAIKAMVIAGEYRRNLDNPKQKIASVELASRYHFILLDHLVLTIPNPTTADKEKTFRLYEQKVRDIEHGNISDKELEYLQSLPAISEWSIKRPTPEKIWESGYFEGESVTGVIENDDVEDLINSFVTSFPSEDQAHVRETCESLLMLYKKKYGEDKGIEMFKNNKSIIG
jgi:hypothetical protein